MSHKVIKIVLQTLLLSVIAIIPFIKIGNLYFPFVSGKVYGFRLIVCFALFFWVWLISKDFPARGWSALGGKNILTIGLILFFIAQIITALFGVSPQLSFFSTIERQDGVIQYGFWVLYFLMLVYTFKNKQDWKILFSVFVITAFIVSCYAWLNLATQGRLSGLFGNPSYLASYLLFAIGFCFVSIERKFFYNRFINILLWALSLFFAVTLFYTQTRGAYLGLVGAVFIFSLLSFLFLRKQNKRLAISGAIILLIGSISVGGLFVAKDTDFVKNSLILSRITEVTNFWELGSIRERILTWQIALEAFKDKPIFGYGPENFSVAFNKHYDFRIGRGESWFDRAHNQFIEPLATGGFVLFSFYIFLLISIFYTIFKISKKEKILSFILASIFLAYIIQGMFLFDTLPVYLGLFPFFAFVVYAYRAGILEKEEIIKKENKSNLYLEKPFGTLRLRSEQVLMAGWQAPILVVTACICLFGIQTTVILPYTASAAAIQFLAGTEQGYYKQVIPFTKKTFEIKSPYTYWELRKRIGWQFLDIIDGDKKLTVEEVKDLGVLYDIIAPELERFVIARPYDPQIYYVLPRIYRLGYQKLSKNDLEKAGLLLERGLNYSDTRVEYYNEMGQVLLLQGKFIEGEKLLEDYTSRMESISFDYFSSWLMGNYYYVADKYDLAMENYKIASAKGYNFYENGGEYSRYLSAAVETKQYQEVVNMATKYLEFAGPNADTYFNIALGDYYLGDKIKAKEFFLKAVELDKDQYQKYESFFVR